MHPYMDGVLYHRHVPYILSGQKRETELAGEWEMDLFGIDRSEHIPCREHAAHRARGVHMYSSLSNV